MVGTFVSTIILFTSTLMGLTGDFFWFNFLRGKACAYREQEQWPSSWSQSLIFPTKGVGSIP